MESHMASFISKDHKKKDEERDENMAKVIPQLDLLPKHVMVAPLKAINVIASQSAKIYDEDEARELDEDIKFLVNHSRGSCPAYQRQGKNHCWNDQDWDYDSKR